MKLMEIEYFAIDGFSEDDIRHKRNTAFINPDYILHIICDFSLNIDGREVCYGEIELTNDTTFFIHRKEYKRLTQEFKLI